MIESGLMIPSSFWCGSWLVYGSEIVGFGRDREQSGCIIADYTKDTLTMISYQWCSSNMPFLSLHIFPFPPILLLVYVCITVYYGSSSEAASEIEVGPCFAKKIRDQKPDRQNK